MKFLKVFRHSETNGHVKCRWEDQPADDLTKIGYVLSAVIEPSEWIEEICNSAWPNQLLTKLKEGQHYPPKTLDDQLRRAGL